MFDFNEKQRRKAFIKKKTSLLNETLILLVSKPIKKNNKKNVLNPNF